MACESCKKKKVITEVKSDNEKRNYLGNFIIFLLIMCVLPFFYIFVCYKLFKQIMFGHPIDMNVLSNFLKRKDKDEDIEEINPEDLELVGVEDLKDVK